MKVDRLVMENSNLVYHLCKNYRSNPLYEDLVQEGFKGMCESANRFDEERNVKFSTYSYLRIWGSVIDCFNKNSSLVKTPKDEQPYSFLSLDAPSFGDDNDLCLSEIIACEEDDFNMDKLVLEEFVNTLSDFEKKIYSSLSAGYTVKEIAELLGSPIMVVVLIIDKILSKASDFGDVYGYKKAASGKMQ